VAAEVATLEAVPIIFIGGDADDGYIS